MAGAEKGRAGQGEEGVSGPDDIFSDALKELDAEGSRIVIRLELRKFRKKTTVVEGLSGSTEDLENVARELKKAMATGGSVKDGIILLQGDQREGIKMALSKMGYPEERIELQ
ncbi:MAG TPA: hypothetical protein VMS77_00325 [Conexivisphaerales archaeon]|nr:hypothetical protein [Conexivisphaerales archaeon]